MSSLSEYKTLRIDDNGNLRSGDIIRITFIDDYGATFTQTFNVEPRYRIGDGYTLYKRYKT